MLFAAKPIQGYSLPVCQGRDDEAAIVALVFVTIIEHTQHLERQRDSIAGWESSVAINRLRKSRHPGKPGRTPLALLSVACHKQPHKAAAFNSQQAKFTP
jgi:hypothetical protein